MDKKTVADVEQPTKVDTKPVQADSSLGIGIVIIAAI